MYRPDLAYIQHHAFAGFAARMAPGLLAGLRRAGIRDGVVLDLGCGDGGWLRRLAAAGYRGSGIELSPSLARLARRAAPGAAIRVGSVHRLPLPNCDAVTALGEVLSYLPPRGGPPSWPRLARRVFAALRPGGLWQFDLIVTGTPLSYRRWVEGAGWTVLVDVSEARGVMTRRIVTFRRIGNRYRRAEEIHRQAVADPARIRAVLREAGFVVRTAPGYGSARLAERRLAFFARKPA